ncbi:helix-turn-helix domain-containing protein [Vibrio sonorensis]|uniref:helix-turn-helix domain-containing protein n=1 Tax=Vibrio sonorensis TaxID=1004316 RepID=UPI0008D96352|nr:AraC family transcriptional regulator [Vibrio sonorensis]
MTRAQVVRPKMHKVAITEKIEESEKQIIVGQTRTARAALVEGQFISHHCEDGFTMHGSRSHELIDSNVVSTAPKSFIITLLLKGRLSFSYDELEFNLNAIHGGMGVLVNLAKPVNFRRRIFKNNDIIKINLMMAPDWLDSRTDPDCPTHLLTSGHLNHIRFPIDRELALLIQKALDSKQETGLKGTLKFESLSLLIMSKVIEQIEHTKVLSHDDGLSQVHRNSVEDIISYIELNLADELTLESLAEKFAMSVSNLQRKFRQQIGVTVNSYIRSRRLDVAKQHLERGLVSITEAAYEAGYNHPANFTIAFKKAYGVPPAQLAKR